MSSKCNKSKKEYLLAIWDRYQRVGRRFKTKILDEFCAVCGYARKYAIGLLKHLIPIRTDNDDVDRPGYLEADTVAHCGNSLAGDFVWSLTFTDIFSQWTENRAVWNKGAAGVLQQVKEVETGLALTWTTARSFWPTISGAICWTDPGRCR